MSGDLLARDEAVIAGIEKLRFFPVAPVGGEGCNLIEADGRRLLDFAGSEA
jgi:4-aminobutyrate aminotransferase